MSDPLDGDTILGLLGSSANEPPLHRLLEAIGALPLPAFAPDEAMVSYRDLDAGYDVQLRDSRTLPAAAAFPAGTPVLFTFFFYSGAVKGYRKYRGNLPRGLSWADTEHSTVAKLGPASLVGVYKDEGMIRAQRWDLARGVKLTASFNKAASVSGQPRVWLGYDVHLQRDSGSWRLLKCRCFCLAPASTIVPPGSLESRTTPLSAPVYLRTTRARCRSGFTASSNTISAKRSG